MAGKKTWFERAIFFSWYCGIGDCRYCYMSTQPKKISRIARRTTESILAEILLCKKLGWKVGFVSGGHNAYTTVEFLDLLKKIKIVYGKKVWVNVGALSKKDLIKFKPYIKGVVASIETINPKVHKYVCPSKPIGPFEKMLVSANKLGIKTGMTIIVGLGETIDDFELLKRFIGKYKISKIHVYGLNPQKGTIFENKKPPTKEYQAEWIRLIRKNFPKIDIQCGIWKDRVNYVGILLKAGANSVSKYPAIKEFGSKNSIKLKDGCRKAGYRFEGTLTKLPKTDWDKEVEKLRLDRDLKSRVKVKLYQYLKQMKKQ